VNQKLTRLFICKKVLNNRQERYYNGYSLQPLPNDFDDLFLKRGCYEISP